MSLYIDQQLPDTTEDRKHYHNLESELSKPKPDAVINGQPYEFDTDNKDLVPVCKECGFLLEVRQVLAYDSYEPAGFCTNESCDYYQVSQLI